MSKKMKVILIAILCALLAGTIYVGYRIINHGKDIIGVTSLTDKNTVIMNSKTGAEFVGGTGYITVGEGQRLHLTYDLSSGSFDLAFQSAEGVDPMDVEHLPTAEEMTGEGAFGKADISGKGSLDFDAAPGQYTAYFTMHGAIGTATLTAAK